jgi:hypothetical protein
LVKLVSVQKRRNFQGEQKIAEACSPGSCMVGSFTAVITRRAW